MDCPPEQSAIVFVHYMEFLKPHSQRFGEGVVRRVDNAIRGWLGSLTKEDKADVVEKTRNAFELPTFTTVLAQARLTKKFLRVLEESVLPACSPKDFHFSVDIVIDHRLVIAVLNEVLGCTAIYVPKEKAFMCSFKNQKDCAFLARFQTEEDDKARLRVDLAEDLLRVAIAHPVFRVIEGEEAEAMNKVGPKKTLEAVERCNAIRILREEEEAIEKTSQEEVPTQSKRQKTSET